MASSNEIVYGKIADLIIAKLEQGIAPWRKPWACKGLAGAPRNFISGKPYRGVNVWLLGGYETPFWLTFKQAQGLGAKVRKGSKSSLCVYWNILEREVKGEGGKPERKKFFFLRYYHVFNVEQCEGIDPAKIEALKRKCGLIRDESTPEPEFSPIEQAQAIIDGFKASPEIKHGGDRAFYSPTCDYVQLPKPESFITPENYYSTAFHELVHSTGHHSRLDREGFTDGSFGSDPYAREELVAEFGATFLCGIAGIAVPEIVDNAASYIAGWKKKVKEQGGGFVVKAASQAQAAADYILGVTEEEDEESEELETALA